LSFIVSYEDVFPNVHTALSLDVNPGG